MIKEYESRKMMWLDSNYELLSAQGMSSNTA